VFNAQVVVVVLKYSSTMFPCLIACVDDVSGAQEYSGIVGKIQVIWSIFLVATCRAGILTPFWNVSPKHGTVK
jgi:hypothetical protein